MSAGFTIVFPLRYQDTDGQLRATLPALVGAMQEAAILHAEEVGRGIQWLHARARSWMIVQTRARVRHLPTWRTRVCVTTWPSEMGRLLSRREFRLSDDQGNRLLDATTLWAFMDTSSRKVCRIPPDVGQAYHVSQDRALDAAFSRPAAPADTMREQRFAVRRWEIDFNGHVNNLRYLDWMLEPLPEEVLTGYRLATLNIRYQKEVGPGARVVARVDELENGGQAGRRFAHLVCLEPGQEPIASAETGWISVSSSPSAGDAGGGCG